MEKLSQQKTVTILRILYPVWMIVGMYSLLYVPSVLIVAEDAATTAGNILSKGFLFRSGIAGSLVTQLLFLGTVILLYKLFKEVDKNQSLLMVILVLVSVPIAMLNTLNRIAALMLIKTPEQMMFFLDLNEQGIVIASIFWGLWLFPLGYLVYKSGYLPKFFGIAAIIGGFGYLLGSFTNLLFPNLGNLLLVFDIMTFGEVVFILWLVIRGAKIPEIK